MKQQHQKTTTINNQRESVRSDLVVQEECVHSNSSNHTTSLSIGEQKHCCLKHSQKLPESVDDELTNISSVSPLPILFCDDVSSNADESLDKKVEPNKNHNDIQVEIESLSNSSELDERIEGLFVNQPEKAARLYRLRTQGWLPHEEIFNSTNTSNTAHKQLALSSTEIRISLDYFKQCVIRSKQMSNTYDDNEATTALLREREGDIEMAATIGLELLDINSELHEKVNSLTSDLQTSQEMIYQLKYELDTKQRLIATAFNAECENEVDEPEASQKQRNPADYPHSVVLSSEMDIRRWKEQIRKLNKENNDLKMQADTLQKQADEYEDKEKTLLRNCTGKLASANAKLDTLYKQIRRKSEECEDHRMKIERLQNQINDLQMTIRTLTDENDQLKERVICSKRSQGDLEKQIVDLNESYNECLEVLDMSRKDTRQWRARAMAVNYDEEVPDKSSTFNSPYDLSTSELVRDRSPICANNLNRRNLHSQQPLCCVGMNRFSALSSRTATESDCEISRKIQICQLLNKSGNVKTKASPCSMKHTVKSGLNVCDKQLRSSIGSTLADSGLQSDFDMDTSECFPSVEADQSKRDVYHKTRIDSKENFKKHLIKPNPYRPKLIIMKPSQGSKCLEQWKEWGKPGLEKLLRPRLPNILSRYDVLSEAFKSSGTV